EAGHIDEARPWRDAAAARYDQLIARHPEAFADHAAEFWLAAGGDPEKGLVLAQRNLNNRFTPRAQELVLQAALAAGNIGAACDVAAQTRTLAHQWPRLRALTADALAACGHASIPHAG